MGNKSKNSNNVPEKGVKMVHRSQRISSSSIISSGQSRSSSLCRNIRQENIPAPIQIGLINSQVRPVGSDINHISDNSLFNSLIPNESRLDLSNYNLNSTLRTDALNDSINNTSERNSDDTDFQDSENECNRKSAKFTAKSKRSNNEPVKHLFIMYKSKQEAKCTLCPGTSKRIKINGGSDQNLRSHLFHAHEMEHVLLPSQKKVKK